MIMMMIILTLLLIIINRNQDELYCRYVYTYETFFFVTEATAVQQNVSDRTKTRIIERRIK